MKHTQQNLMSLFIVPLAAVAIIYALGEFANVDMAILSNMKDGPRFVLSTVIILATIVLIPLALRLFKFKKVEAELRERKEEALLKWGSMRLAMLGLPLMLNTLLYYLLGFESSLGYMAVIVLLTMPFVVPTMSRCEAETTFDSTESQDQ